MEQNAGLTIALILVALAVLMQAGAMIGIWLTMRKIPAQIEAVRAEVKQRLDPLAQSVTEIVNNAREPLRTITSNLADISKMLRERTTDVDTLVAELVDKSRSQIIRVDQMVPTSLKRSRPPRTPCSAACWRPCKRFRPSLQGCGLAWSSCSRAGGRPASARQRRTSNFSFDLAGSPSRARRGKCSLLIERKACRLRVLFRKLAAQ